MPLLRIFVAILKLLRLNKSLADTNGALVLDGAKRVSTLASRLPIQTGLLPYDALYFCCKDRKYF